MDNLRHRASMWHLESDIHPLEKRRSDIHTDTHVHKNILDLFDYFWFQSQVKTASNPGRPASVLLGPVQHCRKQESSKLLKQCYLKLTGSGSSKRQRERHLRHRQLSFHMSPV